MARGQAVVWQRNLLIKEKEMENWIKLRNGGELFEGADASDFPEAPLGKEIGEYESDNEFIIIHASEDDNYTYITHRFPGGGGDTGIVMRFKKY